jgi:hypothetical protein
MRRQEKEKNEGKMGVMLTEEGAMDRKSPDDIPGDGGGEGGGGGAGGRSGLAAGFLKSAPGSGSALSAKARDEDKKGRETKEEEKVLDDGGGGGRGGGGDDEERGLLELLAKSRSQLQVFTTFFLFFFR